MGKGLSSLQKSILEILGRFQTTREAQTTKYMVEDGRAMFSPARLARSKDIVEALGRKNTLSNRVVVSKALARLMARGLVDVYSQGRGYRYSLRSRV
jgi:hypothetical protein